MMRRKHSAVMKPWHVFLLTWLAFRAGMLLVNHDWVWFWAFTVAAIVQTVLIADTMRSEP